MPEIVKNFLRMCILRCGMGALRPRDRRDKMRSAARRNWGMGEECAPRITAERHADFAMEFAALAGAFSRGDCGFLGLGERAAFHCRPKGTRRKSKFLRAAELWLV